MLAEFAICVCALVGAEAKASTTPPKETPVNEKVEAREQQPIEQVAGAKKIDLIAIEKQIVTATNAERARYGLPPLAVDGELMDTARTHCAWMTNNEVLHHTSLPVAENIAMGQQSTDAAIGAWMRSPGHRANMLNGTYRWIGVAAYRTPRDVIFWCQQFRR